MFVRNYIIIILLYYQVPIHQNMRCREVFPPVVWGQLVSFRMQLPVQAITGEPVVSCTEQIVSLMAAEVPNNMCTCMCQATCVHATCVHACVMLHVYMYMLHVYMHVYTYMLHAT